MSMAKTVKSANENVWGGAEPAVGSQKARVAKAMAADAKMDAKKGIKQGSARDQKIDAKVRAKAMKGK